MTKEMNIRQQPIERKVQHRHPVQTVAVAFMVIVLLAVSVYNGWHGLPSYGLILPVAAFGLGAGAATAVNRYRDTKKGQYIAVAVLALVLLAAVIGLYIYNPW